MPGKIARPSARGVPVKNTGGSGTANAHWRESILTSELMTGWAGPGNNLPLSTITIGSLADLGYTVNYAAADSYSPSFSSLAAARQAPGSNSAAVRLVGLSATSDGLAATAPSAGISSTTINVEPRRSRPLADMHARSIDANLADYVLAHSRDSSDDSPTANDCSLAIEDATPADHVWADLAMDWSFWPAIALA